jgi:hypothetical protein
MSARIGARLFALERMMHLRDQQAAQAREAEKWQEALKEVRKKVEAVLRSEPIPDGYQGPIDPEHPVRKRLMAKLEQTRERLRPAMGGE